MYGYTSCVHIALTLSAYLHVHTHACVMFTHTVVVCVRQVSSPVAWPQSAWTQVQRRVSPSCSIATVLSPLCRYDGLLSLYSEFPCFGGSGYLCLRPIRRFSHVIATCVYTIVRKPRETDNKHPRLGTRWESRRGVWREIVSRFP